MAAFIVAAAALWAKIGLGVAVLFVTVGAPRVEPGARNAWTFRPMLIPAVVLIWPLVLWRWFVLETGRDRPHARHQPPLRAHAPIWIVLAIMIPAVFLTGTLLRQNLAELARAPEQLSDKAGASQ
ncbi:hypothetical protein [Chachezhania sediminis]|uniref:hypothetical protein n=1 Tax=Chachezhania sediminis TaxID=2599291 RepID=UPI0018EF11E3|nr:hypothetical protein [Chachezhania sediminis]